jgi:HAD superfamily hydrolase (TIGR01509 family)
MDSWRATRSSGDPAGAVTSRTLPPTMDERPILDASAAASSEARPGVAARPDAVVFDLDGVLIDSEQHWNEAKEALVRESGGRWRGEAPTVMMGMSSPEWSAYLRDDLDVPMDLDAISRDVMRRMEVSYRRELPLLPGAAEAVQSLAGRWPLGLASSANREIIDLVLELAGFADAFRVTVSSEEVERGKPGPDVYLDVAQRLGADPARCVAIGDALPTIIDAEILSAYTWTIQQTSAHVGSSGLPLIAGARKRER